LEIGTLAEACLAAWRNTMQGADGDNFVASREDTRFVRLEFTWGKKRHRRGEIGIEGVCVMFLNLVHSIIAFECDLIRHEQLNKYMRPRIHFTQSTQNDQGT
jgi:hypothetical protein